MAKLANWEFKPSSVGWGTYDEMLDTISAAIGEGPWLLGEQFTMADIVFGGTVRWMRCSSACWTNARNTRRTSARLNERPAAKKSEKINARVIEERQLGS